MRKLQLLLIVTLLTGLPCLQAQHVTHDTIQVRNIAQDHGLSQLNALSLDFDSLGYLWIATQNGLNRFNGISMEVFKANGKSHGLLDDHIRDLYYSNDTLWMATNTRSIIAYLISQNRYINFEDSLNLNRYPQTKFAYKITALNDQYMLAGTIDHCILIDKRDLSQNILNISEAKENEFVLALSPYQTDQFLFSTNFGNSYLLDLSQKSIVPFDLGVKDVKALLPLDHFTLLVGTENGLFSWDKNSSTLKAIPMPGQGNQVRSLFHWDNKHVFVGGENENHLLDNNHNWQEVIFANNIGKSLQTTVLSIKNDTQGGKWIGTDGRGVFYHHPNQKKFSPYRIQVKNAPKKDFISMFNFLREGDTLWMATEFGIVNYLFSSDTYKLYLTQNLDYTLAKDLQGGLWAGGFGDGLMKYNRKNDSFESISLPIEDKEVIQITPVSEDSLWIHTWSDGIYSFNILDHKVKKKSIKGSNLIRSRNSFIDSKGSIWLASDNGLYQIQNGKETYYDSLSNERVFAIDEDPEGNIWVGTAKGLNKISNGKTTFYLEQEGLPNDFIYGLESDSRGHIWVSTNYGISEFNPDTESFKNYTDQDGLQNNEFNGKASYKDEAGYLYFGGMNGFNIFHPDSIYTNQIVGQTVIESVELFGKPIDKNVKYLDQLSFSHDQNVITFNFVTLSYLWPEKNHYQFMLKGFDQSWRPVTKENSTTYTNLDPGTYQFIVKGSNNEMIWGPSTKLTITIRSPWYATMWFKGLLIGTVVFVLLLAFVIRDHQQKKNTLKLKRMVDERTKELTKSNRALNESLTLTRKQKENISFLMRELNHRVKNNLQLITSLIDFQNISISDQPHSDKLKQLQSRIFTVSKVHDLLTQSEMEDIRIDQFFTELSNDLIDFSGLKIDLQLDLAPIFCPSDKLTYLGLVLNELITNSIKHAFDKDQKDKIISIQLNQNEELLKMQYRDNGKGLPDLNLRKDSSIGFQLMDILTEELNGSLQTRSEKGAIFIFEFKMLGQNGLHLKTVSMDE
ncbi:ligand-binding sensor domain-containing protein [Reichenbachiella ulvae]|uniref:Histidine kinase domain-containing protein n=1 Tax=Reichenbachiella ulvae TaxID=2980104 RepID=A0ABT3CZK6_9BACT|nr:two-component regulator propeller domain-containing protein [Reichenbachiella ulvae]MCV9388920.1 hypothetical protein [Reichenbachiella ulvae]